MSRKLDVKRAVRDNLNDYGGLRFSVKRTTEGFQLRVPAQQVNGVDFFTLKIEAKTAARVANNALELLLVQIKEQNPQNLGNGNSADNTGEQA